MKRPNKIISISDEEFTNLVSKANRLEDVYAPLGYKQSGTHSNKVRNRIKLLGLTTSHFNNWNTKREISTQNLLIYGTASDNQTVKRRIIKEEIIPYYCKLCNNTGTHNENTLILHSHHIDGDKKNNDISNLRFLCPNCHSQTHTYGGRNNKGIKRK